MATVNSQAEVRRTPLFDEHLALGANMVSFAGWMMPLHYGSQLKEHEIVRADVAMFDVSHMAIIDVRGKNAESYLRKMLANDLGKIQDGRALYGCMLNEKGGILDDLITYKLQSDHFRLVVNAAMASKDFAWLEAHKQEDVQLEFLTHLGLLAVQGPNAIQTVMRHLPQVQEALTSLKPFHCLSFQDYMLCRTGYTGEDGLEIITDTNHLIDLWRTLVHAGVQAAGLGARDTLRLEAGLNLYGTDMDESTNPFESNLSWTLDFKDPNRDFIGRKALELIQQQGVEKKLVGLVYTGQGIMRNHMKVRCDESGEGEITSGSFSPTLKCSVALARIPNKEVTKCEVLLRGQWQTVTIVPPSFVRKGKPCFEMPL